MGLTNMMRRFLLTTVATVALAASAQAQQLGDVFYIDMENHNLTQPSSVTSPQQLLGNPAAPFLENEPRPIKLSNNRARKEKAPPERSGAQLLSFPCDFSGWEMSPHQASSSARARHAAVTQHRISCFRSLGVRGRAEISSHRWLRLVRLSPTPFRGG